MIFKFNLGVFSIDDESIQTDIVKILFSFIDKKFLWDSQNLYEIFFDEDNNILKGSKTIDYIGPATVEKLCNLAQDYLAQSAYITEQHKFYLSTIEIGMELCEFPPSTIIELINKPSLVFLENGTNDWKFIKGLIFNYCNIKRKKNIFKRIKEAVDNNDLIPQHVGGGGDFVKIIDQKLNEKYRGIEKLKFIAVFDSDKNNSSSIPDKWYPLISYLRNDKFEKSVLENWTYKDEDIIYWHMLYKRELENYIPKSKLLEHFGDEWEETYKREIEDMCEEKYDFFNFSTALSDYKNQSPEIFLETSIRELLQERCKHHLITTETPNGIFEDIDEPEYILQKLAKLI